jgi:hypothetical protein
MSDEARMQSSSSGKSTGETGIGSSTFDVVPWVHADGHHVRKHARSARRRQGSPLCSDRALCARLARVGVASWTPVIVGERETLTAPLSERVTLAIA